MSEPTKTKQLTTPPNNLDGLYNILPSFVAATYLVGSIIFVATMFVFTHDKITVPNVTNPLKSLHQISLKELKVNLSLNTNSFSMTLVAFMFILVALCFEVISLIILMTNFEDAHWTHKLEMLFGPICFLGIILVFYIILQDHRAFQMIVNNRVPKSYHLIMPMMAIGVWIYMLIIIFKFMRKEKTIEFINACSYSALILFGLLFPLAFTLAYELRVRPTDG
jgi:uncharacterized membrane protein YidH (DUF202 family)